MILAVLNFSLLKNSEAVQTGNTRHMITSTHALIAYISKYFTLKIGDLIFTGTPAGVGKVESGDVLEGKIEEKKVLRVRVR